MYVFNNQNVKDKNTFVSRGFERCKNGKYISRYIIPIYIGTIHNEYVYKLCIFIHICVNVCVCACVHMFINRH